MDIVYYYNDTCGCCKGYEEVVEQLGKTLEFEVKKINLNKEKPSHQINGIPTVILEQNGVELYRSMGNVKLGQLYKDIKDFK